MNTSIHKLFSCECRYENVFKVCDAEERETFFASTLLTLFTFTCIHSINPDLIKDQLDVESVNTSEHLRSHSTLLSPNFEKKTCNSV
jgi:hypothetical protein